MDLPVSQVAVSVESVVGVGGAGVCGNDGPNNDGIVAAADASGVGGTMLFKFAGMLWVARQGGVVLQAWCR